MLRSKKLFLDLAMQPVKVMGRTHVGKPKNMKSGIRFKNWCDVRIAGLKREAVVESSFENHNMNYLQA